MSGRSQAGYYDLSSPFNATAAETASALFGPLLLRDEGSSPIAESERHFNDLYHLFLNRFARLSHDAELSDDEAERLVRLLTELLAAKKKLTAGE